MKTKNMTTPHSRKSISLATASGCLFMAVAMFAPSQLTRAQCPQFCDVNGNTAFGDSALVNNTTGIDNTAIGGGALTSNTHGKLNTATGLNALVGNTTGSFNTATGGGALQANATGNNNTATGNGALFFNTTGGNNTATGYNALQNNTAGNNTATGVSALNKNTTGNSNTATGVNALFTNTTGTSNTATGKGALNKNNGGSNSANGYQALNQNTTGNSNTADGADALFNNTTGSSNIALGVNAGFFLTTGSHNIDISNEGNAGESGTIRIGDPLFQTATFIYGISGAMITGTAVVVSSSGQLGVAPSSRRFKAEIEPMDKANEAILALKPVTFRYKHEIDPKAIPQFGLVAEEVEKVNPDLVVRDSRGEAYTVRYEAVNAMLLNEFLKEHKKVEQLQATVAQQQKGFEATLAHQEKQIEALTAGLQKVSAQLELSKPARQTVLNNR